VFDAFFDLAPYYAPPFTYYAAGAIGFQPPH
jgi:hypothetical protein